MQCPRRVFVRNLSGWRWAMTCPPSEGRSGRYQAPSLRGGPHRKRQPYCDRSGRIVDTPAWEIPTRPHCGTKSESATFRSVLVGHAAFWLNRVVESLLKRSRPAALVLLLFAIAATGFAVEKSAIAANAQVAFLGRLAGRSFPWFDGWQFSGKLTVTTALWGAMKPGDTLEYRFVCRGCPMWPRPDWSHFRRSESLWFVRQQAPGVWTCAGVQAGDPGARNISDLKYYEELFNRRRGAAGPAH